MRQAAVVGLTIAAVLVFGQLLMVSNAGAAAALDRPAAAEVYAPAAQTTATAVATPGALPNTGADTNLSLVLLGAVALVMLGATLLVLVASRRSGRQQL